MDIYFEEKKRQRSVLSNPWLTMFLKECFGKNWGNRPVDPVGSTKWSFQVDRKTLLPSTLTVKSNVLLLFMCKTIELKGVSSRTERSLSQDRSVCQPASVRKGGSWYVYSRYGVLTRLVLLLFLGFGFIETLIGRSLRLSRPDKVVDINLETQVGYRIYGPPQQRFVTFLFQNKSVVTLGVSVIN